MKMVIGFFTTKPGKREEYLAAAPEHLRLSRLDPDCRYLEIIPMPDHPDRLLLAEAFDRKEAHCAHRETDHMRELWAVGERLLAHVAIDTASHEHKVETFG